jgi:hypothetical protein
MIVRRVEENAMRVQPNGDIIIPAAMVRRLLHGDKEDLQDFGPGRILNVSICNCESGTSLTLERDRRVEAAPEGKKRRRKK